MAKPKRDPIESIKTRCFIYGFCALADIEMSGPELSLYVEKTRKNSSKWHRFIAGETTPSEGTVNLMLARLATFKGQESANKLRQLFDSSIWLALAVNFVENIKRSEFYKTLPPSIQSAVLTPVSPFDNRVVLYKYPNASTIKKIERNGSLDALACLMAMLREDDLSEESFAATHIDLAAYRLLLSFFQHPHFNYVHAELWQHIRKYVLQHDEKTRRKMGIGFWDMSAEDVAQVIEQDRELIEVAKQAKIISIQEDINPFLHLFYRYPRHSIIKTQLESISNNESTCMAELNMFITLLNKHRPRRNQTEFADDIHPHLRTISPVPQSKYHSDQLTN